MPRLQVGRASNGDQLRFDLLEYIRCIALPLSDLFELGFPSLLDEHGFARQNISIVLEPKLAKSNAFRGKHVVCCALDGGRRSCADKKRADSICVSESQNYDGDQLLFSLN